MSLLSRLLRSPATVTRQCRLLPVDNSRNSSLNSDQTQSFASLCSVYMLAFSNCDHLTQHHHPHHYHLCHNHHLFSTFALPNHRNQSVLQVPPPLLPPNAFHRRQNLFTSSNCASKPKLPPSTTAVVKTGDNTTKSSKKAKPLPDDIHVIPKLGKKDGPLQQHSPQQQLSTETMLFMNRNFITTTRAMREYALDISDLGDLRKFQRRSPYNNELPLTVYLRKDVELRALSIWKSWDRLNAELARRKEKEDNYSGSLMIVKKYNKDYRRLNTPQAKTREEALRQSARVVMAAVTINAANCVLKFFAWMYTGSHSLFAETVHSFADTCNQLILAYGIRKSLQVPNKEHPYGYHPMRYIASLISGVAIFCTGTSLSVYHGVNGLMSAGAEGTAAAAVEPYTWAFLILLGSLISEGGTLVIALTAARKAALEKGVSLRKYILRGHDPTLNVVILEDTAAVSGVLIAATCMGATSLLGTPVPDAIGSLLIGGLLGLVASFVIITNSNALLGRSIPPDRMAVINRMLESDGMVRAIHDVKATDMGNDVIRYKAEVDFDGRKLANNYLNSIDLEALFAEFKDVKTIEECEEFMLKHGENIVDLLGAEVDRIETELKQKHPQVRHVDLEVL